MKKDSLGLKILAGVLAAVMIIPIIATAVIYFLQ